MHSTSTTSVLRERQKVYILPGVLNFQRVRDPLGLQLRSFHNGSFFILNNYLTSHMHRIPLGKVFRSP